MNHRARRTELPDEKITQLSRLKQITPYIWEYRGRVLLALFTLIFSKLALVALPILLKHIVDALDGSNQQQLTLPLILLLGYALLRITASLLTNCETSYFPACATEQ